MKALGNGRRALNWMGIHFVDDEPVSRRIMLAQNTTAFIFAITFITIALTHVKTFFNLRTINPEEFFFVLLQFVMTAHGCSAFVTIYTKCGRVPMVFQELTEIYGKCKQHET